MFSDGILSKRYECSVYKSKNSFTPSHMQVQLLVAQPTLMKDLDQFNLLAFNAMEQKLDYRTVLTQHKTLALTQPMLVLRVLVSSIQC